MENQLKQVCLCLQQVAAIEDTITSNKLSFAEVAAVMEMVDLKRRGYLDLNDIFELVGKVTQSELFAIFKHLDRSRTGEVRVTDLQGALGNSQLTSSNITKEYVFPRFYKIVDTIKDRPKLTREAVKQNGLTPSALKSAYQYICDLVQSKYLSQEELITIFKTQFIKNGLKWTSNCEGIVRQLFPGQNVSQARFIEAFAIKNGSQDSEEECLLKGISDSSATSSFDKNQSIYTKLKFNDSSPKNNEKHAMFSRKVNNFQDQTEVKTPVFQQINIPEFTSSKTPMFSDLAGRSPSNNQSNHRSDFDQIQDNISSVLDNIQQRREKLRQDSLERKKLIEDVMNRKKQLLNTSDWNEGISKDWERDQFKNTSNVKKVAKSYLNHNPTFYQTQQLSRHNREDSFQTFKEQPIYSNSNEGSSLSYERSCGHLKTASPPTFTHYEPKRNNQSAVNSEISQILKKYTANTPQFKGGQESTLKSLCKSKSGFIYQNPSQPRESSNWRKEEQFDGYSQYRNVSNSSSKVRDSYKENVMRRAEEEAAKKIEEIQRKARMKVLEKKGRREDLEWNRLMKHGHNF